MKTELSQFTSLLTWWWLPSFGSNLVLNFLYSSSLLSPPTSPRARANHLQLTRTAVILATLLYQLYTAVSTAPPNYYHLLGVPLDVDSEEVRRSFRALARKFHPDKVGEQGEQVFILLRRAHDALSDPVKQAAYDRFGPAIVEWKDCESARDYLRRGLMQLVAFYTINPALYALVGYLQGPANGLSFWRLSSLFALFSWEVNLLVSPTRPAWMSVLLPTTTIHDLMALAHGVFVNFFFASLQLCAALDVLEYGEQGAPARDRASKAQLMTMQLDALRTKAAMVDGMASALSKNVVGALAVSVRPYRGSKGDGEMSEEGERLWAKIDEVLLARTILQQNPGLAAEIGKGGVKREEKEEVEKEEEPSPQEVKLKQEQTEESVAPQTKEVAIKTEEVEPSLQHEAAPVTVKQEDSHSFEMAQPTTAAPSAVADAETLAPVSRSDAQVQEAGSVESTPSEPWVSVASQDSSLVASVDHAEQQPTEAIAPAAAPVEPERDSEQSPPT